MSDDVFDGAFDPATFGCVDSPQEETGVHVPAAGVATGTPAAFSAPIQHPISASLPPVSTSDDPDATLPSMFGMPATFRSVHSSLLSPSSGASSAPSFTAAPQLKPPASKRTHDAGPPERTRSIEPLECISCNAELEKGPRGPQGVRCQLSKCGLPGVSDLPALYFCADACSKRYRGASIIRPMGQRLVARIQKYATGLLGTDLRCGDPVHMKGSLDANRYVYDGDGKIVSLKYVKAAGCARIYVEGMGALTYECWPADVTLRIISGTGPTTRSAFAPPPPPPPPVVSKRPLADDDRERAVASQARRARIAEVAASALAKECASGEAQTRDAHDRATEAEKRATSEAAQRARSERASEREVWRAGESTASVRAKLDGALGEIEALALERDIIEAKANKTDAENARLTAIANRVAGCSPQVLSSLRKERANLSANLRREVDLGAQLQSDLASSRATVATQAAQIADLQAQLAARPKPWVPARCVGQGAGRGRPHDEMTRLLYGKLLTLRAPPSELAEIVATCVYAVLAEFPDELKKMELPTDSFARNMRPELGLMHAMISALTVGAGELVAWVNDASPSDGRELGAVVARVKSIVNEKVVLRHCHMSGSYETADATAAGEALAIKEKCFDR